MNQENFINLKCNKLFDRIYFVFNESQFRNIIKPCFFKFIQNCISWNTNFK